MIVKGSNLTLQMDKLLPRRLNGGLISPITDLSHYSSRSILFFSLCSPSSTTDFYSSFQKAHRNFSQSIMGGNDPQGERLFISNSSSFDGVFSSLNSVFFFLMIFVKELRRQKRFSRSTRKKYAAIFQMIFFLVFSTCKFFFSLSFSYFALCSFWFSRFYTFLFVLRDVSLCLGSILINRIENIILGIMTIGRVYLINY